MLICRGVDSAVSVLGKDFSVWPVPSPSWAGQCCLSIRKGLLCKASSFFKESGTVQSQYWETLLSKACSISKVSMTVLCQY